jgi:hypothetical protein
LIEEVVKPRNENDIVYKGDEKRLMGSTKKEEDGLKEKDSKGNQGSFQA